MKKNKIISFLLSASCLGSAFQTPRCTFAENNEVPFKMTLGDVNGDGKIDAADATAILVYYSALSTGGTLDLTDEQIKLIDVNGDGKIDSSDATLDLQYYSYTSTGGTNSIENYITSYQSSESSPVVTTVATNVTSVRTTGKSTARVSYKTTKKTTKNGSEGSNGTETTPVDPITGQTPVPGANGQWVDNEWVWYEPGVNGYWNDEGLWEWNEPQELKPVELTLKDCAKADFVGKWECKKIVTSNQTLENEYYGIPIYTIMNVTFNANNTGTVGSSLSASPEYDKPDEFSWILIGNQATIIEVNDDEPAYAGFDGDNLVFFDKNKYAVYYFDKVDEFTPFDINEFYSKNRN